MTDGNDNDSGLFPPLPEERDIILERLPEDSRLDEYSEILESQCGATDDSQPVEQYDGSLGVPTTFVAALQGQVGQIQWNNNLAAIYDNPGNVSGVRWCTGTLITNNLFLSAGHCFDQTGGGWQRPLINGTTNVIPPEEIATNMHVNFNFQVDPLGNPRPEVQFAVAELVEYRLGGLDFAILRLDGAPGQTFGIGRVAMVDPPVNNMLCIIGHPAGVPKRIEAGPLLDFDGNQIQYNDIDTLGGNSGSALWNLPSSQIVGVHTNGGCTTSGSGFNFGVRVSRLLEESPTLRSLIPRILRCGDSGSQAGFVSEITAIRHLNQQVVTAVRTQANTLKLISWRVNPGGSVTRTGDSSNQAGTASNIGIARGSRYVTACRDAAGNLQLISWNIDAAGAIQRAGDSGNQAGTASRIKVVALSDNLFITACRDANGRLKLITWRLNNNGTLTRRGDSGNTAGIAGDISLIVLRQDADGGQAVTSVRAADGSLKLIVWDISANGNTVTRLGDSGSQAGQATMIHSVVDPFGHVVTAIRAANDSLKLISWDISADGSTVTRLGDSGSQAGFIGSNAVMLRPNGVLSAVRTEAGTLKLIDWSMDAAGTFTRQGDSGSQAGQASLVTLTQEQLIGDVPIVSAVRTAESTLKLITWREA